jgi:hypothetical protein
MRDSFDIERPSVLMFSHIGAAVRLVGVAYTFYVPIDRMTPRGWKGPVEVWHAHDNLARVPGRHIVMMHAWLIDGPLGPLAHDNPWLPYLAAGVAVPSGRASDTAAVSFDRRVGLALAALTDPPAVMQQIQREGDPIANVGVIKLKIDLSQLVSSLRGAEVDRDTSAARVLRERLAVRADTLVSLYREAASKSESMTRTLETVVRMYLGTR